jgi:GntR family transcriptional regulator/MocR family aminotransferase
MLMPGLRVGFLLIEGPIYDNLVNFKHVNDLATSTLIQRALEAYVTVGRYQAHLRRSCQIFRKRRDAMVAAIHRYLPGNVQFDIPQGGLFLWVRLPDNMSADELLLLARQEGVDFVPGSNFFNESRQGRDWMRLNFVVQPLKEIEEGIMRLGQTVKLLANRQ